MFAKMWKNRCDNDPADNVRKGMELSALVVQKWKEITMPEKIKCCECGCFIPYIPYHVETTLFDIPVWHTIMCITCGKKAGGLTYGMAIKAWNRRAENGK